MSRGLPVLVEVRRGAIVEARHCGAIVAVEPDGRVRARLGDAGLITSTRSAIKPIQAIPFITGAAADHFRITPRELAVVCASHNGEPMHTEAVAQILARIGLSERALLCGAHRPFDEACARDLESRGAPFTALHNNCSGKHAGMLATAVHGGLSVADYLSPAHPVQRAIISTFARIAHLGEDLPTAVDGCSAPTFGVSLHALARAFAQLAGAWATPPAARALRADEIAAVRRIVRAMIDHPLMVGGSRGRLDSDLIRAARGQLICKIGAESVYAIGVLPNARFPQGLGVGIKVADGASRALSPVVIETLAQLGVLAAPALAELEAYHWSNLTNWRDTIIGEIRAVFELLRPNH